MNIPDSIKQIADDLELNYINQINHDGNTYYSLGMVDENGECIPIGLPIIYKEIEQGKYIALNEAACFDLLKKLNDDE